MLLIKQFNFVFIKDLSSIAHSNIQAVATAENEEQTYKQLQQLKMKSNIPRVT